MIRLYYSLLLVVLLTSTAWGQRRGDPHVVAPGDLVVLSAEGSGGDTHAWVFLSPPETNHIITRGGLELVFSAGCQKRTYHVVCLAITLDESGKPVVASFPHTVHVNSAPAPPEPDDPPRPDDPPVPDVEPEFPAGKYGLASFAYKAAKELPVEHQQSATALAANFSSVAASIAAGVVPDLNAANAQLAQRNQQLLGDEGGDWKPWLTVMSARMRQLWQGGTLRSLDDHAIAFREIAHGLSAVSAKTLPVLPQRRSPWIR